MNKIESFKINHDVLQCGIYLSRVDGDVITYDIRTRRPNMGDYMENSAMHTIEHLFASFVRNSIHAENVIYFGPMGCRTGFYFLLRDAVPHSAAIELIKSAFEFIRDFTEEIPGCDKKECGNYLEHNLELAKLEAEKILEVIVNWKEENLYYS